MGYARRCLLALVLFSLLSTTALPVVSEGTTGIHPGTVVLPGRGEVVPMNLTVVRDSVIYGATLDVEGSPSYSDVITTVGAETTIGFSGSIPFPDPDRDLAWYMSDLLSDPDLDNASSYDSASLVTEAPERAYQVFFVEVDPAGLSGIHAGWIGRANGTVGNETDWGARLFIYENTSKAWEALDSYDVDQATDVPLSGYAAQLPWHYVNRTLAGEDRVIVMVQTAADANTSLATDFVELTYTYATYPVPRMDLGGDGRIDWGLGTSAATGELGRVAAFADNSTSHHLLLPEGGGHNDSASFLIPPGVHVQGAWVDYVPFPSQGQRQRDGYSVSAPAGDSSYPLNVTGIPLLSHQRSSQVVLTDVIKHDVPEQTNEGMDEAFPLVAGRYISSNQSVAQSFKPAFDGPLTGIDVFFHDIAGNPGNITIEVREMWSGEPTGALLATSVMKQEDYTPEAWNHFTFTPVQVQAEKSYAIRFHALEADPQSLNGYVLGYDENQNYTRGTGFLSMSLDGSTEWSSSLFDIAFRTYMDYPIDARDAANLSVLGRNGTMANGQVFINVSGFDYVDGNWSFQVANANPFAVTFDWSAWTKYILYAESPSLDVGGDGTVEWQGYNVSTTVPLNITEGVQRVADAGEWPLTFQDLFGNVFYRVPINVTSTSEGELSLRNLVVLWNGSVTTTDLADVVDALRGDLVPDADGMVNITINVSSKSAGTLTVTSVDVLYDLPPYSLPFPDVVVPEDQVSEPLDLDTVIFDDHDNNDLNYTVVRESGDAQVFFNLTDDYVLTFWGPANWSGEAVFHVVAVDSSNLTYRTNPFNVTIAAVEDPPLIHGLEDSYVVYFGIDKRVPIDIEDNDSDLSEISISASTSRVWGDVPNMTLHFLFPFDAPNQTVEVNISDGEAWSVYSFWVYPEESNEPPEINLTRPFVVTMDAQGVLDLRPLADDLESKDDELVWSVVGFPDDLVVVVHGNHTLQVIPVATQDGDRTVHLTCTDPDGNVVHGNLTVRLVPENRHPPVILRGDDALPGVIKVRVNGKEEVNLALQKYWYDQEDFNQPQLLRWEAESLRPSLFSVDLDSNYKLTITAYGNEGSGYLTLRLFDSDNDFSRIESVQVVVTEPTEETSSWLVFALAAVVLILVGVGLMVASRGRKERTGKVPEPMEKAEKEPEPVPERPSEPKPMRGKWPAPEAATTRRKIRRRPPRERPPAEGEEEEEAPPAAPVPGRIRELLVIHESTSLITQVGDEKEDELPPEREDELIEMSTLFAQERFEDTKVGTIKAFRFNGEEVLVGKGRDYFLVARCSGTDFDDVAREMKRSIVNIDVNIADKISDWYPGQKITPLEEELRALMSEGSG